MARQPISERKAKKRRELEKVITKKVFVMSILVILCLTAVPATAQLADTPWPMFYHDLKHTGLSPLAGPDTAPLKWTFQADDKVYGSPSIGSDGTVYVSAKAGKLYAFGPGQAPAEPPHLVTYTISNRTITPPQTTEIDVEFSEKVSYKIALEKDTATIYDWTGTAKNPNAKVWAGTYEVNGTVVPDGDYTVNVTGTNTTTGLSVVNTTEVITVMSTTEQPDLLVSEMNAYHYEGAKAGSAWFNLSNEIDVTVKNNGTADAGAFNVSLYADGEFIEEQCISNLSAGSSKTPVFEWTPIGTDEQDGGSPHAYSLLAEADPYNEISESNETNNNMTASETVMYNGYMADEPLTTFAHGTLRGGLLFTTGDGLYSGAKQPGLVETIHYNLDVPPTSSVELAKLNVYYTWYKPYGGPTYPQMRVEITNQTGTYNVSLETAYNDRACSFSAWNLPLGNYAYDLGDYITGNGSYTVSIYNNGTGDQQFAIAAPGLVVLYKDDRMPQLEYWLVEGADVLMGGRRSDSGSYLAWWECMNNATFEGSINLSEVKNATLGVVSPWAGSSWEPGMTNYLFFNDVQLGTGVYHDVPYEETIGGIRMRSIFGGGQVGVDLSDVTALYLNNSENVVTQADDGDNIMTANAFLVVEYEEEAVIPWQGYLVPQDSTGSYGGDTEVELWVEYNDIGLPPGAVAYQVDIHFDPGCVNITSADFSTSPFEAHMFTPYAPGVVRILEDNIDTMIPISSGTYRMATFTLHGESTGLCSCNLWFDYNLVSDTDGEPITNTYTNGTYTGAVQSQIFDTGAPITPYPSIAGVHNGTITPNKNISVNYLYTYPCTGTGGHTEFAMIWNETTGDCAVADWHGYKGDYHNISFNRTLPLKEGVVYSYTIRTGSYPQIHHTPELETASGWINCTSFEDVNGIIHNDSIPAIRLWA